MNRRKILFINSIVVLLTTAINVVAIKVSTRTNPFFFISNLLTIVFIMNLLYNKFVIKSSLKD